jgi:hypothetical protein
MNNCLRGAVGYLAGPIDFCPDLGTGTWREEIKKETAYLGINYIDPTSEILGCKRDVNTEQDLIKRYKSSGDYESLRIMMQDIRRKDLRSVDLSDFLVCYIDTNIFMFGSVDELITAERQCKPIFGIFPRGIQKAPSWAFAVFKPENMFTSIDGLVDELHRISLLQDPGREWVIGLRNLLNKGNE